MPVIGATDSRRESVRPDKNFNEPCRCCGCGCVMAEEVSSRTLAPVETDLEEGGVHVEDESEEEDSAELKHAKDIVSPAATLWSNIVLHISRTGHGANNA